MVSPTQDYPSPAPVSLKLTVSREMGLPEVTVNGSCRMVETYRGLVELSPRYVCLVPTVNKCRPSPAPVI